MPQECTYNATKAEKALIKKARKGDQDAVKALFAEIESGFNRAVYHYSKYLQRHMADDLRQAGWSGILHGIESYDHKLGPAWYWLLSSARRAMFHYARKFAHPEEISLDELLEANEGEDAGQGGSTTETAEDQMHQKECEVLLHELVNALVDTRERYVARALFLTDDSPSMVDVAASLGCHPSTVKDIVCKIQSRFKRMLMGRGLYETMLESCNR